MNFLHWAPVYLKTLGVEGRVLEEVKPQLSCIRNEISQQQARLNPSNYFMTYVFRLVLATSCTGFGTAAYCLPGPNLGGTSCGGIVFVCLVVEFAFQVLV